MVSDRPGKAPELDARTIKVSFSPRVKLALSDLAAAVHFSDHFESDIRDALNEWTADKQPSIHDVLIVLPHLASETFRHIHATGDTRAEQAWDEFAGQLNEKGFALSTTVNRRISPSR